MTQADNKTSLDMPVAIELPAPDDTDRLGSIFAQALTTLSDEITRTGLAIRLEGNLGAGKTTLVRAALRTLGWTGTVKSPTFTLLEGYPLPGFTLNHFDFYRFESPEEFEDAGFAEEFGAGFVCCTEWSEKAEPFLPSADLVIELEHVGFGRRAHLRPCSATGSSLLRRMSSSWHSTDAA